MSTKQQITILGSTGSIGVNTLDVVARHNDKFAIYALTANKNWQLLLQQVQQFQPQCVVLVDPEAHASFLTAAADLGLDVVVKQGANALASVASASPVDVVMAAIVGAAGLPPSLAAAEHGKRILLANKEALVMTGRLFMDAAKRSGAVVLPVDSEHNAIFQCIPYTAIEKGLDLTEQGIRRLVLTASGGPFLRTPIESLVSVTPAQACKHPNWDMGRKISVDSATMMNKGLELIEAHYLFNAPLEQIDVVIQPQSVVHSMVEYCDGSVLAELGLPDMRTPIANVLGLPARLESGVGSLNFAELSRLDFFPMDTVRFPLMTLARWAIEMGETAPTWLNAANEVAVQAFLDEQIKFTDIHKLIAQTLDNYDAQAAESISSVIAADECARDYTQTLLKKL